jgi:hypothetical protein
VKYVKLFFIEQLEIDFKIANTYKHANCDLTHIQLTT